MMSLVQNASRRLAASAAAGFAKPIRHARPRALRSFAPSPRRTYASTAHTVKKASSDIPWLIAAAVVTVPGVFYVLQPSGKGHAEHDDHASHDTHHHDEEGDKGHEDSAPAEQADKPAKDEEDDQDASTEGSESNQTKSGKVEGVNFAGGTKKLEPDAKGATKKRIDSDLAKNIGEGASSATEDDMSKKQRGLSNTDTRHSVDISQDPGKSKKGEGTAETAKVKGTVSPDRPQV